MVSLFVCLPFISVGQTTDQFYWCQKKSRSFVEVKIILNFYYLCPFLKSEKITVYVTYVLYIVYATFLFHLIILFFLKFTLDYDKTINDTEGTVSSPRYYGKYPNNVDHYVTIMNREGSRIVLQFLLFDVHSTDFLEVRHLN